MRSATAITYELDDISMAAEELLGQIREKIAFAKESVGILHAQPEMEIGELSAILSEELGFPVIGGTTAGAATLSNEGHHELAVILHVLTADDCIFSVALSPSLTVEPSRRIIDTYHDALAELRKKDAQAVPQMALCVTSIIQAYSSDDTLATLSEAAGGLPIFGYVAADDFQFRNQQVFLDGECADDVLALLLIAGNIRPIFEVKNLAGSSILSRRRVTKAHDNVICEIDGKPAYEYIREFPFISDQTKVLWNYQFFVEMQEGAAYDDVLISRAVNTYDSETGEIFCFANVPENSSIGLLYCEGKDVEESAEAALCELRDKINAAETPDYHYSTVLIASCSLRNMFLANQKAAEGDLAREILSPSLTISGLYGFGEIAPTSIRNGKAVNRFHNATITICAF